MTSAKKAEALTPAALHVLLALGQRPAHGYAIMRQAEEDSGKAMGPGTIYGTLSRLEALGWVRVAGEDDSDPRRGRLFALTGAGREALRAEIDRIHGLTVLARKRAIVTNRWP
jgi:DNA-binding PadR family transcriptional regulator